MINNIKIRRARPLLGTIVEITAYGNKVEGAVTSAFHTITEIHNLMSFFENNSDLSRINSSPPGKIITIDKQTYHVLSIARQFSIDSQGAFDVTASGNYLAKQKGYLKKKEGSFQDIVLYPDNRVMRTRPVYMDLGGIAKGYAVDQASLVLQLYGATSGIINAGGDLRLFGNPEPIYIRYPEFPNKLAFLGDMKNISIATSSGVYGRESLISPSTGINTPWRNSITVLAPECIIADALTKIVRLSPSIAMKLLDKYHASTLLLNQEGIKYFTPQTEAA